MIPVEIHSGDEFDGQVWDQISFRDQDLSQVTFSHCRFVSCDFSSLVLSGTRFENCEFSECNLSNTVISNTRFDEVVLRGCKLAGLNFGAIDTLAFGLRLEGCLLRYVNFSQLRWRKAVVQDCDLHESDFRGGQYVEANFQKSRFRECRFSGANLTGADFRFAEGYDLDPRTEQLKKAKFSLPEAMNLLSPFGIDVFP